MTLVIELSTGESIEINEERSVSKVKELALRSNFQHHFIADIKDSNGTIRHVNPNHIVYIWEK